MRQMWCFLFQAEDGIRDGHVTGVQTCALPIFHDVQVRYESEKKDLLSTIEDEGNASTKEIRDAKKELTSVERSEERRVGKESSSRKEMRKQRDKDTNTRKRKCSLRYVKTSRSK